MVYIHIWWVQTLGAGTFDEVFGPGNTPMWALPTDVIKYQKDEVMTNEIGLKLNSSVSGICWLVIYAGLMQKGC